MSTGRSIWRAHRPNIAVGEVAASMARMVPIVPAALITAAALLVLWSQLSVLGQPLWGDEVISITRYISPGPSGIWSSSAYLQNDHVLFELLTWATADLLGTHLESTYRLWSVFPAMAGAGAIVWWLWRRFDRWTAAVFAVLIAVSPVYYLLAPEARGYGLEMLASAGVLIGADGVSRCQSRRWVVLFGLAGFVGSATLPSFSFPFVGVAAVLLLIERCRRPVLIAASAAGIASLLMYAPLLSAMISSQNHGNHGQHLWEAFVVGPLRDLLGQEVVTLASASSATTSEVVAAVLIAFGAVTLWRAHRILLALILVPTVAGYVLINVFSTYAARFGSFALLPLLALVAIGLGGVGRNLTDSRPAPSRRWRPAVTLGFLVVGSLLLLLGRFAHWSAIYSTIPYESGKRDAQFITSRVGRPQPIFSSHTSIAFAYYLGNRARHYRPRAVRSATAARFLCRIPGSFVYVAQVGQPDSAAPCMRRRRAIEFIAPQHRPGGLVVWLVPARSSGRRHGTPAPSGHSPSTQIVHR